MGNWSQVYPHLTCGHVLILVVEWYHKPQMSKEPIDLEEKQRSKHGKT